MQKQAPVNNPNRPITPESPTEPADLLCYNKDYQVVICSSCEYAIQPRAIARHLKEIHRIRRHHRRPYANHVSELQLSDPEKVLSATVSEDQFPVSGLPVHNGLQCLRPGCGHLCVTTKRMQKHWTDVHQETGCVSLDWQMVPLQTFFRGNLLRYFTHPSLSAIAPPFESEDIIKSIHDVWDAHKALDETDQHLLLSYLRSTHLSLANRYGNAHLWQVSIPRMAASLPFLRHGILGLSALHMACRQSLAENRDQLLHTAHDHQDKAMALFQEAILAGAAMETRCHAIIAFIHVQSIFTLAVFPDTTLGEGGELLLADPRQPDLEYLSPWLFYIRQGCHLVCGFWDTVSNGPLGPLANSWEIPITAEDEISSQIVEILGAVTEPDGPGHSWPREAKACYLHAATDLAIALSEVQKLGEALSIWDVVRLWPLILTTDFIFQLKDLAPGALLLVACYTVALERLDTVWFAKGVHSTLRSNVLHYIDSSLESYYEKMVAKIKYILDTRS